MMVMMMAMVGDVNEDDNAVADDAEDETEDGKAGPLLCVEVNITFVLWLENQYHDCAALSDNGDFDDLYRDSGIAERERNQT